MYWCKSGLSGSSCLCSTCIQKDTADSTWTMNRAQEKNPRKKTNQNRGLTILKCKQSSNFPTRCYGTWSWKVPKIMYSQLWLECAVGGLVNNPFMTSVTTSVRWSKNAFYPIGNPSIKPNLGNRTTDSKILLELCMCCKPCAINWNALGFDVFFILF